MDYRSDAKLVERLGILVSAAAIFCVLVGLLVLTGWTLHIAAPLTWGTGTAMAPNSAACFVLAGLERVMGRQHATTPPTVQERETGIQIMDSARLSIEQMAAEENRLLYWRSQRTRVARKFASSIIAFGSILAALFLSIAGFTVSREIGVNFGARAQIRALNADLEQRVEQRTAALQAELGAHILTQAELRVKEHTFRVLLDGIKDYGVYMLDPEGRLVSWNSGAASIQGYQAEEILGRNFSCFYSQADRENNRPQQSLREASDRGRVEGQGWRVRKDGSQFWAYSITTPVYETDGTLRGYSKIVRDITERKRAEEALREKELLLSESQRIAHVGSWTLDPKDPTDGLVWSDELYRLYGVSADTFTPTIGSFLNLIIPDDRSAIEKWVAACANGQKPVDLEFRLMLPDGAVQVFSLRGELQYDADNKPIRIAGTSQDITERRQAEAALRESEDRFQAMANGMQQLAWMAEADGSIFWYNQRWYEFTGTTLEQMQGWGWQGVHHPDVLAKVTEEWKNAIAAGQPFNMEFSLRGVDGLFRGFLTRVMPSKDSAGRVVRWFGTNTDISERKETEERLAAQAEELRGSREALETQTFMLQSVLDSMIEGLVAADEHGKFILWNPAAGKIVGLGAANLPPTEWSAHYGFYLPDTVTPIPPGQTPLERAIRGEVSSTEIFLRNPGLSRDVWLEINSSPLRGKDGVLRGGMAAFRDITRRKADELEIRKLNEGLEEKVAQRTLQLEAANRELEAFSYSVSHDLRTPLRHIAGFSRILANEFGPGLSVEARDHVQRIEDAVCRMGLLVNALLKMATLRRQSLKLQLTELNPIVDEVISILQPECEGRDVEWQIGQLPALECDPVLIAQVFQNLLSNALKYSRGRSKSVIEVDSIQQADKPAIIFVRDNGAGFDMRYADKLFSMFRRLHTDAEFEGTGVGLATVHRIIQKHGGMIWAEAEVDHGATFYFALQPTEQPEGAATAFSSTWPNRHF